MGKVLVSRQSPKVDMVEVLSGRMGTSHHEDLGRQMAQQSFSHRLRPLMAQPNPVLSVNRNFEPLCNLRFCSGCCRTCADKGQCARTHRHRILILQ